MNLIKNFKKRCLVVASICIVISCTKKSAVQEKPIDPPPPVDTIVTIIPVYDHVVVVILENKNYEQLIDTTAAPYIDSLAKAEALFTQSFGIEHPSQPNYLDLYAGSNQGITSNTFISVPFKTPNLGRQLIDIGKTFQTFSEDLPSIGWAGDKINNYVSRHNASSKWMGTDTNQVPVTTNQPFSAFPSDFTQLPTISFVVPNLQNDMHDGSILKGDTWIKNNLGAYVTWAKTHNSLFILTFDEDDDDASGNHIPTIFAGQHVKRGSYSTRITHFTILRTLEDMYHLPYAANAASATSITYCWN